MKQALCFCFLVSMFVLGADNLPIMRISVENTDSHVQTIAIRTFAERLQERTADELDVRFYSSASLLRDGEAVRSMVLGNLEMAVPGTWHIDSLVPEVGLFLLPIFYGVEAQVIYDLLEGPLGQEIVQLLEDDLFVKVPGRWIDLGHAHLFSTTKKISSFDDIVGLSVRVAGGFGNEARISAMGGFPSTIFWPDLPERLNQGIVQGVLTSYESVRSASLWNYGIKYAFEDRQYFAQYIPMVSRRFWNSLSPKLQEIIIETWEEGVDTARNAAADAQKQAKNILLSHGVDVTVPDTRSIEIMREKLLARQLEIADSLGIPRRLAEEAVKFLAAHKSEGE